MMIMQIVQAWNDAGRFTYSYQNRGITNTVNFAFTGWPACEGDTLSSYSSPDPEDGLDYQENQVYP